MVTRRYVATVVANSSIFAEMKMNFDDKFKGCELSFAFGGENFDEVSKSNAWGSESYDGSLSNPAKYVKKQTDENEEDEYSKRITEDDILHEEILEDFNGNLSQIGTAFATKIKLASA